MSYMYVMYFDHIHPVIPLLQLSLNHPQYVPVPVSYPLLFPNNPLSPVSVACVCMVVGSPTGAWATCQWPHTGRIPTLFPSSHQLPSAPQLWAGPAEPSVICAGGLTLKPASVFL